MQSCILGRVCRFWGHSVWAESGKVLHQDWGQVVTRFRRDGLPSRPLRNLRAAPAVGHAAGKITMCVHV